MKIKLKATKNFVFVHNNLFNNPKVRYIVCQGGTRSGKTYSILQNLILYAVSKPNKRIHIISVTIPHIKNGVLPDFKQILNDFGILSFVRENKRDLTFKFANNSIIKFYSADKPEKLRGFQKDIVFINECNLIDKDSFDNIDVRLSEKMILDFNPTAKFWLHDFLPSLEEHEWELLITTYKDNPYLTDMQIRSIESRKSDPIFWSAYGEGLLSKPIGLILPNFQSGKFIDTGKTIIGVDFGYTDPTAIVMVSMDGNILYAKEIIKQQFLSYNDIAKILKEYKEYPMIADNNEPRVLQNLRREGLNIFPVTKGKNSVQEGLQILRQYKIIIDETSNNLWSELISYKYSMKSNLFAKADDHLIDAMRYAGVYLHSRGSGGLAIGVL